MGQAEFQNYYQSVYQERWAGLLESLGRPEVQAARLNKFANLKDSDLADMSRDDLGHGFLAAPLLSEIPRAENGCLAYYIMDPASIVAAQALNVQPGDSVLDLCAAPGGKTLILAEAMQGEGELIANEMSAARRERLKKVLQQYIPREQRNHIWVTGHEGARWGSQQKDRFDRILLDAPCSGERHLLKNPSELSEWKESRTKHLAQRQYALISAARIALKPGGRMVYSTCSISPLENDEVIAKLLKKWGSEMRVVRSVDNPGNPEPTEYGAMYLPDRSGWGPIYFCILEKVNSD